VYKFNRNYILQVGTMASGDELIQIEPPFTLEFDVTRTYASSQNNFSFRIYNLAVQTRNKLRKDVLGFQAVDGEFRPITLSCGYDKNLSEIAKGNVTRCWSVREGKNWITTIEGFDAGFAFANGTTSVAYQKKTPIKTIIADLMASLKPYGVTVGSIGNYEGEISRGNSYSGNTLDILRLLTGGGISIDNGTAHALKDNECIDDGIIVINSDSGLLGTPQREQTIVNISILFEPKIKINQLVRIDSATDTTFNDVYRVTGVHHRGTISEAICGDAITELTLTTGKFDPIGPYTP
jgi:hypothetical protein